jgi:hypothetical protein
LNHVNSRIREPAAWHPPCHRCIWCLATSTFCRRHAEKRLQNVGFVEIRNAPCVSTQPLARPPVEGRAVLLLRQRIGDGRLEILGDVGDHQPDHVAGCAPHHSGSPVGYLAHLGRCLADPELGVVAEAVVVDERAPDRGDGQLWVFG